MARACRAGALAAVLAASPATAHGDCPVPSTELAARIDSAEQRFAAQDGAGFAAEASAARAALECLAEPIPRPTAADLHRLVGLTAFAARDADLAVRSFASARAIEPDWTFPESLLPAGHPIRADYTSMDPATSKAEPVRLPKEGRVEIDGASVALRPVDRPVIFQRFDRGGAVIATRWLAPGEALPAYAARRPRDPAVRPLLYATMGSAVVTGGLLVAARVSLSGYAAIDAATPEGQGELAPARSRTNGLLTATAVAGGLALSTGAATLVVHAW